VVPTLEILHMVRVTKKLGFDSFLLGFRALRRDCGEGRHNCRDEGEMHMNDVKGQRIAEVSLCMDDISFAYCR
jgi:hypothetical protein